MNCHSTESKSPLLTTFAIIYGVVFLAVGVLGFIPQLTSNGLLFGYFNLDALHNVVHLTFGLIGLWAASCPRASQIYFRVVGIIFVILALLGFWHQEQPIFDVISNNLVDAIFHLVIGVIALILGFVTKHKCHNH
jgi:hypothetical protein